MNQTLELLLLSYTGIVLHYLFSWKEIIEKKQNGFNWKLEIPTFFISVISASVLIYVREDIAAIFPVTPIGAVILGYFGQDIFNKVINAKAPAGIESKTTKITTTETKETN